MKTISTLLQLKEYSRSKLASQLEIFQKVFLNNASRLYSMDKREENLKEKLAEERKEKAEYAKKAVS